MPVQHSGGGWRGQGDCTDIEHALHARDLPVMAGLVFALGWSFHCPGRINRLQGGLLVLSYIAWLLRSLTPASV